MLAIRSYEFMREVAPGDLVFFFEARASGRSASRGLTLSSAHNRYSTFAMPKGVSGTVAVQNPFSSRGLSGHSIAKVIGEVESSPQHDFLPATSSSSSLISTTGSSG